MNASSSSSTTTMFFPTSEKPPTVCIFTILTYIVSVVFKLL
jgi:hypothetical protein